MTLDRLEDRTLLSGVGDSKFAVYQGRVVTQASEVYAVPIDRFGFRPAQGNQVLLRIDAQAAQDGALDPGAVELESNGPRPVQVLSSRGDSARGTGSVVVAAVGPGSLAVRPTAEGGTEGAYEVGVSLAGDVNGDFRVDRADLFAIRSAFGRSPDSSSGLELADVDGDGEISLRDWNLAFRNFGAATSFRPLELTAGVDPSDDPDGDGAVGGDVEETELVGRTRPGSTVNLDADGDGVFETSAVAGADGSYSFTVPLVVGANPFAIQAISPDGQVVVSMLTVTRGDAVDGTVTESFDFTQGDQGWNADFADLPTDAGETYELDSGIRDLPEDLDDDGTGYLLQSHNRSDDVFMYLTRKLTTEDGIVAGREYQVSFTIKFASNAPSNAVGIGGAPGEAVVLKAGASGEEPATEEIDGYDRLNVDKGNNSEGGSAASVAGNIANGLELEDGQTSVPYVSITREHTHTATVTADAEGNLWLIVGTDSGFEGLTAIYFQSIDVTLTPVVNA